MEEIIRNILCKRIFEMDDYLGDTVRVIYEEDIDDIVKEIMEVKNKNNNE